MCNHGKFMGPRQGEHFPDFEYFGIEKKCKHNWVYFNFHTKRRCQSCGLIQEWDNDDKTWVDLNADS